METSTSGELTEFLQAQMLKYQTSQLVGVRPDEFRKDIEAFLHMNDADMEEFIDPKKQRDLSINFHWGHNHVFGDFRLEGHMQNRQDVTVSEVIAARSLAVATRHRHGDMMRSGLSARSVR